MRGTVKKGFGYFERREKKEEREEKRDDRSEKRETSTIKMRGSKDAMVRSKTRRDGTEKVRSLSGKREESR